MSNEIKEEVIILLNEARNKISKASILYSKTNQEDVYIKTILDLLNSELYDLTGKKND